MSPVASSGNPPSASALLEAPVEHRPVLGVGLGEPAHHVAVVAVDEHEPSLQRGILGRVPEDAPRRSAQPAAPTHLGRCVTERNLHRGTGGGQRRLLVDVEVPSGDEVVDPHERQDERGEQEAVVDEDRTRCRDGSTRVRRALRRARGRGSRAPDVDCCSGRGRAPPARWSDPGRRGARRRARRPARRGFVIFGTHLYDGTRVATGAGHRPGRPGRADLRPRHVQRLGQHPGLRDRRHEVGVGQPPRQAVDVQVVRHAGARAAAQVRPHVHAIGVVRALQRDHRVGARRPRAPRARRARGPRARARPGSAAPSGGRSRRGRRSGSRSSARPATRCGRPRRARPPGGGARRANGRRRRSPIERPWSSVTASM